MTNILLTGATGFLGKRLLEQLLKGENRVYALVRPDSVRKLNEFIDRPNIEVVLGDVIEDIELLSVEEIWHLAALTEFSETKRELIKSVNYDGTINLINFAKGLRDLKVFHFLSTAYVAGITAKHDVIDEVHGPVPSFRNPYEEFKFKAEGEIINSGLPYIVYRPSIIMGDAETGEAETHKMVYGVFRGLFLAKKISERYGLDGSVRSIGFSEADHNLVTINDVIDAMVKLSNSDGNIGKIFHLTNETTASNEMLYSAMAFVLNVGSVHLIGPFCKDMNSAERALNKFIEPYREYMLQKEPRFDRANFDQALPDFEFRKFDIDFCKFLFQKYLERSE